MPLPSLRRMAQLAFRGYKYWLQPRLAWIFGFTRSNRQTVLAWPASGIALGPRVAVFCHFDRAGMVRDHVLHYVRSLKVAGLDVVFVTNSGRLQTAALERVQELCAGVLVRRNIGYDFGAWREALEVLRLPRSDTEMVVLVNDSLYGPLRPIDEMLSRIDFARADVWGLTESWQNRYHLQSFFLAVSPRALSSVAWRRFWKRVRPVPSKHWIIERYEVGLSQAMLRAGLRCKAIWPYAELVAQVDPSLLLEDGSEAPVSKDPMVDVRKIHARRIRHAAVARVPLNPTSDLWRQLLLAGFPFLKRELLRDNPTDVQDLVDWRIVLERDLQADPCFIELDLQRAMRNRTA
jgi:hypothetical protein